MDLPDDARVLVQAPCPGCNGLGDIMGDTCTMCLGTARYETWVPMSDIIRTVIRGVSDGMRMRVIRETVDQSKNYLLDRWLENREADE